MHSTFFVSGFFYVLASCLMLAPTVSSCLEPDDPTTGGEPVVITPNLAITCEGERGTVQCPEGQHLNIVNVFWGRDDTSTCSQAPAGLDSTTMCECNADNVMQKVQEECQSEQTCDVIASNIFFSDNSCGTVYKYLKIWYECVDDGRRWLRGRQLASST